MLGKVDLNRWLPPYPHLGRGTNPAPFDPVNNPTGYSSAPLTVTPNDRFDDGGPLQTQFTAATQNPPDVRQRHLSPAAARHRRAVGGQPGRSDRRRIGAAPLVGPIGGQHCRFYRQGQISTPFNFYGVADGLAPASVNATSNGNNEFFTYWVFGTELPKVVLNEVLAEYNTPQAAMGGPATGTPFGVNLYAELFCPLPSTAQASNNGAGYPATIQGQDTVPITLWVPAVGANVGYSPYIVALPTPTVAPGPAWLRRFGQRGETARGRHPRQQQRPGHAGRAAQCQSGQRRIQPNYRGGEDHRGQCGQFEHCPAAVCHGRAAGSGLPHHVQVQGHGRSGAGGHDCGVQHEHDVQRAAERRGQPVAIRSGRRRRHAVDYRWPDAGGNDQHRHHGAAAPPDQSAHAADAGRCDPRRRQRQSQSTVQPVHHHRLHAGRPAA